MQCKNHKTNQHSDHLSYNKFIANVKENKQKKKGKEKENCEETWLEFNVSIYILSSEEN